MARKTSVRASVPAMQQAPARERNSPGLAVKTEASDAREAALERKRKKQRGSAEGTQPGIFHDLQSSSRRCFHEKPVAAVRHPVEMETAGYSDPDEAPDNAAERRGQDRRRQSHGQSDDETDDESDDRQPGGYAPERGGAEGRNP